MRYWLPLFAACSVTYLLGYMVGSDWGGFYFLSHAILSMALFVIVSRMISKAMPSFFLLVYMAICIIQITALFLNLTAMADYYSWYGSALAWYYETYESRAFELFIAEVGVLLIYPAIWVRNGGISRLCRSILASVAGYFLDDYSDSLGLQVTYAGTNVQRMRSQEL